MTSGVGFSPAAPGAPGALGVASPDAFARELLLEFARILEAVLRQLGAPGGPGAPGGEPPPQHGSFERASGTPAPSAPHVESRPQGGVRAGQMQLDDELRRARERTPPAPLPADQRSGMRTGAPPGFKPITGRVPPGVAQMARSLLRHEMGTEIPFELDGKRYLARVEPHYHPPGFVGGPNGWHKGVTVYQAA